MNFQLTLGDMYDYIAREYPEHMFTSFQGRTLSFGQASVRANQIGNALAERGCKTGDRVALLSKNSDEMAVLFMAAARFGFVPVPLNYRLAARELRYMANDAQARAVIVRGADLVATLDSVKDELNGALLLADADEIPHGWQAYQKVVAGASCTSSRAGLMSSDTFYQVYTSGTTGHPKGVEITHDNIISYNNLVLSSMPYRSNPGERVLMVLPMYHVAGAVTVLASHLGGVGVVIHEEANPAEIVEAMDEDQIVGTTLVPALIQFCLAVPGIQQRRFESLRFMTYGASSIAPQVLKQALEVFNCDFLQGFGMTESTAAATVLTAQDHVKALGGHPELLKSAGRAMLGTQIRIVDERGQDLPPNTIGEIALRGPQVMKGYWNQPEKTAETVVNGWLMTGDAGRVDEQGYLFIEDRIKDMIVAGGENIYPREIEIVLFDHPRVADAAVIGVADEKWGEAPLAVLVSKDGEAIHADELVEFCRGRLAGYKIPRRAQMIDALPRNPSGKVLKTLLRDRFAP